jgi:hypothetical protein
MTDTPDDIQRKIAHLEGQRALLGDAAVDAAIAALRAQPPPAGAALGPQHPDTQSSRRSLAAILGFTVHC